MAPFGPGNPEPVFAAADVRIERPMALRGGHVRCTLVDQSGGKLKAVAWRVEDSETGRRLMTEGGAIHVVGRLKPDDWQGRQGVEFEIDDVADPRRA
jgi:single-stranded-DNA-specific exonuclease